MKTFLSDERGQGLVEYGLILGLIAMVAVGALLMVGGSVNSSLGDRIDSGMTPGAGGGGAPIVPHVPSP